MNSLVRIAALSLFLSSAAFAAPTGKWQLTKASCSDGTENGFLNLGLEPGGAAINSRDIVIDFPSYRMTTTYNADLYEIKCRFLLSEIVAASQTKLVATLEAKRESKDCAAKRGIRMDVRLGKRTQYVLVQRNDYLRLSALMNEDFGPCPKGTSEVLEFKSIK